jgi:glycosyltransferase involved in cell wall biosynthesis
MIENVQTPILAIVIPCFNEEAVLSSTISRLFSLIDSLIKKNIISNKSFIFLVDDGSRDKTFEIIEDFHNKYPEKVRAISFSKNFGNQKALLAGILEVRKYEFDCCITIDADLQQDENRIEEFVEKFNQGNDLVIGVKNNRNDVSVINHFCAILFYKMMNILGAKTYPNHSEYRLVSKKLCNVLAKYSERNLFLRGTFQEFCKEPAIVYYDVKPRQAGNSKFSLLSLFSLAIQGITSFSIIPLRLVTITGFVMASVSFLYGFYVILEKLFDFSATETPGWATIVVSIFFIGGIQILCLGIIGEYLGQVFQEVKARPRYIVEKELN